MGQLNLESSTGVGDWHTLGSYNFAPHGLAMSLMVDIFRYIWHLLIWHPSVLLLAVDYCKAWYDAIKTSFSLHFLSILLETL